MLSALASAICLRSDFWRWAAQLIFWCLSGLAVGLPPGLRLICITFVGEDVGELELPGCTFLAAGEGIRSELPVKTPLLLAITRLIMFLVLCWILVTARFPSVICWSREISALSFHARTCS